MTMVDVKARLERWRNEYHEYRPHSTLSTLPPAELARNHEVYGPQSSSVFHFQLDGSLRGHSSKVSDLEFHSFSIGYRDIFSSHKRLISSLTLFGSQKTNAIPLVLTCLPIKSCSNHAIKGRKSQDILFDGSDLARYTAVE